MREPEEMKSPHTARPDGTSPMEQKQKRELWLYVAVGAVALDLLLTISCICYAFITTSVTAAGVRQVHFPLIFWAGGMVALPTLLVLAVHGAMGGLFSSHGNEDDAAWQEHLPERFQRIYKIVKGAPAVLILLALLLLGVALATIDGMLSALVRMAETFSPYIPYLVGGVAAVACCVILAIAWYRYNTRKLYEEYAFRREVFERSGIIIADKGSYVLESGDAGYDHAIEGTFHAKALPQASGSTMTASDDGPSPGTMEDVVDVEAIAPTDAVDDAPLDSAHNAAATIPDEDPSEKTDVTSAVAAGGTERPK